MQALFPFDIMNEKYLNVLLKNRQSYKIRVYLLTAQNLTATGTVIDDVDYAGLSVAQLIELKPSGEQRGEHSFAFLADATSHTNPEHPILVVELRENPGQVFRVIPTELWSVENNLALGNMDFKDFAQSVDADGVFRGWPKT